VLKNDGRVQKSKLIVSAAALGLYRDDRAEPIER
jgi:hypothetical protein